MTKCFNCKSAMTPRQAKIGLNAICTNPNQTKGLVKLNYGCKFGGIR